MALFTARQRRDAEKAIHSDLRQHNASVHPDVGAAIVDVARVFWDDILEDQDGLSGTYDQHCYNSILRVDWTNQTACEAAGHEGHADKEDDAGAPGGRAFAAPRVA